MAQQQQQVSEHDLNEKVEALRRATGVPYRLQVGRARRYALIVETNERGEPMFDGAGGFYVGVMPPDTAQGLLAAIETFTTGIQLGIATSKKVYAQYLSDRANGIGGGLATPNIDRAEFCDRCGALVFAHGDDAHFDVRESHEDAHDLVASK